MKNKTGVLLNLSGVFYGVLCIFSIVTGLLYACNRRELNPIELSDKFVKRLSDSHAKKKFARFMGWVTFAVGIVQGLTAVSLFLKGKASRYFIALGFTVFSIFSVSMKLARRISLFALTKVMAYTGILIVLLFPESRRRFSDR